MVKCIAQTLSLPKEDSMILEYGLKKIGVFIEDIVFTLICGWILGIILESMIFQVSFMMLRIHAGGYHAKNEQQCKVQSAIVTVLALVCIKEISFVTWHRYLAVVLTSIFIAAKAPVETPNKPLTIKEKYVFHKKSCIIIALLNILTGIFMSLQWRFFANPLAVTIITVGGLIGAYQIAYKFSAK